MQSEWIEAQKMQLTISREIIMDTDTACLVFPTSVVQEILPTILIQNPDSGLKHTRILRTDSLGSSGNVNDLVRVELSFARQDEIIRCIARTVISWTELRRRKISFLYSECCVAEGFGLTSDDLSSLIGQYGRIEINANDNNYQLS
jgi:hypothetical protein